MVRILSTWICALFPLCVATLIGVVPPIAFAQGSTEDLLARAAKDLSIGPEATRVRIAQLAKLEPSMTALQRGAYYKIVIASYAFRGMYTEQVEASKKALALINDSNQRASLLYYLSDGYSNLGQYDESLQTMNEAIGILPKVSTLEAKIEVLQSAYSLYESLHAYEEAASYAERLMALPTEGMTGEMVVYPRCVGLADLVELAFLNRDRVKARSILPDADKACEAGGYKNILQSVHALDYSDRLTQAKDGKTLAESLALFDDLTKDSGRSDYSIQLADAIANRYLANGEVSKAEEYATKALQWANAGSAIQMRQQANETMASALKALGKLDAALTYLDVSNKLWAKLVEERSHKEMAYLRMKFKAQDQSNQLSLLSQINKLLTSERELQERNKHILELLVIATALLLTFASIWLFRTWRQKNDYRAYSQVDGLTKISNRSHFIECAHQTFKDARGNIAVILFDMDEFKLINDTYSHAAGDWVLKTIGATIAACLRTHDMFGRLGGEEFAICLPHTSEQEALALAERCRGAIEDIDSTPSGHQFSLSASFGIAVRPPNGVVGFEEVLAAADRALYQAKHMGRNRIVPYGEVIAHSPLVA